MTPGEYLKMLRRKNKISQEELAKKMNFERSTIAKYENNTNQMKYDVIKSFSVFFNEPIINIINGDSTASNNLTIENDEYLEDYYKYKIETNNKYHTYKTIKLVSIFIIIIIIMIYSIICTTNKYKEIKSYLLHIEKENIDSNILIIDTIDNFYLNINEINVQNEKIISLTIYYTENSEKYYIYQITGDDINHLLLMDNIHEQSYFNFNKKKEIINNLHFIIRTDHNQTYETNTKIYTLNEEKTNEGLINKKEYKLEDKYNDNIYNLNTIIEYKKNKYRVKSDKDTINIVSNANNTDIKINNNLIIGTYDSKEIIINTSNINDNDKLLYNEIKEILNYAIKNTTSY